LDVSSTYYNPAGSLDAGQVHFPWRDGQFDVILAVSLFTHLLPAASQRYLTESSRLLKVGGRLFATWFLWRQSSASNPEAVRFFPIDCRSHRIRSLEVPEGAVSLRSHGVFRMYRNSGLRIVRLVAGHWETGEHCAPPFQDILVAQKGHAT
jgi:SAM-dependent methyltransferase